MKAESGTIFSKSVLTDWPVDAAPWPVVAIAFMLALRAVSAAIEFALAELVATPFPMPEPEETDTVPATAFVSWEPFTTPPVALT